eukprot:m.3824 g.3824  ORF g.3824 m.3824 type:complete len:475 (-) comp6554_c0_seq3:2350-3774(-)
MRTLTAILLLLACVHIDSSTYQQLIPSSSAFVVIGTNPNEAIGYTNQVAGITPLATNFSRFNITENSFCTIESIPKSEFRVILYQLPLLTPIAILMIPSNMDTELHCTTSGVLSLLNGKVSFYPVQGALRTLDQRTQAVEVITVSNTHAATYSSSVAGCPIANPGALVIMPLDGSPAHVVCSDDGTQASITIAALDQDTCVLKVLGTTTWLAVPLTAQSLAEAQAIDFGTSSSKGKAQLYNGWMSLANETHLLTAAAVAVEDTYAWMQISLQVLDEAPKYTLTDEGFRWVVIYTGPGLGWDMAAGLKIGQKLSAITLLEHPPLPWALLTVPATGKPARLHPSYWLEPQSNGLYTSELIPTTLPPESNSSSGIQISKALLITLSTGCALAIFLLALLGTLYCRAASTIAPQRLREYDDPVAPVDVIEAVDDAMVNEPRANLQDAAVRITEFRRPSPNHLQLQVEDLQLDDEDSIV